MESGPTIFDMSDNLESINNGSNQYYLNQIFPISGNVANNTPVGTGSASGQTTFQFEESANWWLPSQSYFVMRLKFANGTAEAPGVINNTATLGTANSLITYCDNFICTLFTQITSRINNQTLDTVTTPWIVDTALGYSKAHWNFIKSFSSMTRMGEGLQTRLLNVSQNNGVVEVTFRPPISLFDVEKLPPGAQFRIEFIWAASAILAFEALQRNPVQIGTTDATYNQVYVQEFSFYKASVQHAPSVQLPKTGVIDLTPSIANQYYLTGGTQMQSQLPLPGTTNRILVVFQDMNNQIITPTTSFATIPFNKTTGVGGGYNPATSFSSIFTNVASANTTFANTVSLSQLWIAIPEIGISEPKPQYNFTGNNTDMMRAYCDWAHVCQGTYSNYEGSLPYGNNDPSKGTQILSINPDTPANTRIQAGDNNNYQQFNAWVSTTPSPDAAIETLAYNQTSRWGWSGSRPGPIFAFPVVRPENKQVSQGILYVTLTGQCISIAATVIATYSMAIAVEDVTGNGLYSYRLVTGV